MRIVIAQFWTKNLPYVEYTRQINEKYCLEKNYIYHVEEDYNKIKNSIEDRAFTWYKPKFLIEVFEKYNPDYILFLDADAIVCNNSYRVEEFIDNKFDCIVTEDHGPSVMNAGVLIFKNTEWTKNFLKKWWEAGDELAGPENQPKGYYNNALWHDQTCFGYLYNQGYNTKIKIIDNKVLNGMVFKDQIYKNFIFHAFAYGSYPNRTLDMAYYKLFNISPPESKNLSDIVQFYNTDKHYEHNYFNLIYSELFKPLKETCRLFLEIGVFGGESIKLWRDYFTNATIVGVEKNMEYTLEKLKDDDKKRIKILNLDQSKKEDMEELSDLYSNIDIIIDDGSHKMYDQQMTFAKLFKSLKSKGIYIIEDLHTSLEADMPEKSWCNWGDKDKTKTLSVLKEYQRIHEIYSDYMSMSEIDYLNSNIKSIDIYQSSPNWSITSVIKKI